jgi:hypothetical protein
LARIPADEKVSLVYLPPRRSLLQRLADWSGDSDAQAPTLSLRSWLRQLQSLSSYPVWTILPGVPEVQ